MDSTFSRVHLDIKEAGVELLSFHIGFSQSSVKGKAVRAMDYCNAGTGSLVSVRRLLGVLLLCRLPSTVSFTVQGMAPINL